MNMAYDLTCLIEAGLDTKAGMDYTGRVSGNGSGRIHFLSGSGQAGSGR